MATTQKMLDVSELGAKSKEELLGLANDVGLNDTTALENLHKEDLLSRLFQVVSARQALVSTGILEIMDEGYGSCGKSPPTGAPGMSISRNRRSGVSTSGMAIP